MHTDLQYYTFLLWYLILQSYFFYFKRKPSPLYIYSYQDSVLTHISGIKISSLVFIWQNKIIIINNDSKPVSDPIMSNGSIVQFRNPHMSLLWHIVLQSVWTNSVFSKIYIGPRGVVVSQHKGKYIYVIYQYHKIITEKFIEIEFTVMNCVQLTLSMCLIKSEAQS